MPYRKSKKMPAKKMTKKSNTLTKKVNKLARIVKKQQPELKAIMKPVFNCLVGQANGGALTTGSGHYSADLTVGIAQGTALQQRIGAEVKILYTDMRMQFFNQANTSHAIKFRVEVWSLDGLTPSTALVPLVYDRNQFVYFGNTISTEVYDLNCILNPYRRKGNYKLFSKTFKMPRETFGSQVEVLTTNFRVKYKGGRLIQYDSTGNPINGQLAIVILADSGNVGSILPTGSNNCFSQINAQTAINFNYFYEHHFIDN